MARERTTTPGEATIPHDVVSEITVVAAALVDAEARAKALATLPSDAFAEPKHQAIWAALAELERRHLACDVATLQKLVPGIDAGYARQLTEDRPVAPQNLAFHVEQVLWDGARLNAARGPVSSLLEALHDASADPERVKALARQVAGAFDGYQARRYLRDPDDLNRGMMSEVRLRAAGRQSYGYGIERLDYHEKVDSKGHPVRRMIPGAAPGQVTVVTGVSGAGKSTLTARIVLGLARNRRKVLYGAWEQSSPATLELLACMSCGFSRQKLQDGQLTEEELTMLGARAEALSKWVRFFDLPFNRGKGEKRTNDQNLDLVQGYVSDSGCDVFVADLWKRCLRHTDPDDEEQALVRQQAMCEELKVHAILVQQQRLKDVEQRQDKRPTREGIKGSSAWVEVADTILGVHRPALWKALDDTVFEIDVLKQRYGKWPQAIEFDWDGDSGLITGGRTVAYESHGEGNQGASGPVSDYFRTKPKDRRR